MNHNHPHTFVPHLNSSVVVMNSVHPATLFDISVTDRVLSCV
ncbi:MAG: hypothetical protein Q8S84_07085 [bacterium]|nr:hypothetical protein [bacterium]MDP3381220.1 hypothetical protein [bacterium]